MPSFPHPARARRAIAVLFAVVFVNMAGFGVVMPLLPFFGRAFHASPVAIGALFSAFAVGQLFAETFWGRLSDRIGRRPVLIVTILGAAAAYFALAFAPNIEWACAIRLAAGLMSGNISTIQGYVADVTAPEDRPGRMGHLGAAFSLGFVTGPGLGGLLAKPSAGAAGFEAPLLVAGGLAAVAAVGVLLFVRETRHPSPAAHPQRPRQAVLGAALRDPVIGRLLGAAFIVVSGFAGMEATYGLWTQARFGWGPTQIGFAFMAVGCTGALAQGLVTGPLARRFGAAEVMTWGMTLVGAGMATQLLSPTWPVAVAGLFAVAFGQSLTFPNIAALISQSAPPERQGEVLGLNMAGNCLARIGGPIFASAAFAHIAIGAPFAAGAALVVPGLVMARQVKARTRAAI